MDTFNGVVMKDPDELHDFARFIDKEKTSIINDVLSLSTMMKAMNETWDDAQNEHFTTEFVKHIDDIQKLSELLEEHSKFVEKKASQIDEYNARFNFER
jgi:uncharacterized protein YukE